LIGGQLDEENALASVYTMNLSTLQMEWNSNMVQRRCDFGGCSVGESRIYVCGGIQKPSDNSRML